MANNWIKVRRKVIEHSSIPGHGGSFGNAPMSEYVWVRLECGHTKHIYKTICAPKTTICPKCSYRKGEKPPSLSDPDKQVGTHARLVR